MNKFSNNGGQPLKKLVVPTLSGTLNLFESLKKSGKVFRVDSKKKDGTNRTFVCRMGVKPKGGSGKGRAYDPSDKGLLNVFEFGSGYRMIGIDSISFVKHQGIGYLLNTGLPEGDYPVEQIAFYNRTARTKVAHTSPMYLEQV